jgi:hypothetical protein
MEYQWSIYSYKFFYSTIATKPEWVELDVKYVSQAELKRNEESKDDRDFQIFSRDFYRLIFAKHGGVMHDLNQLISIDLLGGYQNIDYYIDQPPFEHVPGKIDKSEYAMRIDKRPVDDKRLHRFIQLGRNQHDSDTIENIPKIPLFVNLAGFIVKNPALVSQLNETAVGKAVDKAISEATAKLEANKAIEKAKLEAIEKAKLEAIEKAKLEAEQKERFTKVEQAHAAFEASEKAGYAGQSVIGANTIPVKGGRRTKRQNKRSGHKRSGHKRSGHNKRSGHKSRRR